jgi:hypothetical protein
MRAILQYRNLSIGVEREEFRRPALAVEDIDAHQVDGQIEVTGHGSGFSGVQHVERSVPASC